VHVLQIDELIQDIQLEMELLHERQLPPLRYKPRAHERQDVEDEQVGQEQGIQDELEANK